MPASGGAGANVATFTYGNAGPLWTAALPGATATHAWDPILRLRNLDHNLAGSSADDSAWFSYNPASQIVTRTSNNDAYASSTLSPVTRTYSVNGLNQYTAVAGTAHLYDLNGNLRSDGATSYVYDAENRLVSATGAGGTVALAYDPLGRLFSVTSGGTTTRFLYDGDELVAEYAGTALTRRYAHGIGVDDPVLQYEGPGLATRRSLLRNHQGSIAALADANGNPVAINGYDAWGVPNPGNQGRFQYTGQIWLAELGLYHYKARLYSPTLGRFMQTDLVGYDDQINLYAYVGNDPVNRRDPTGNRTYTCTSLPSVTPGVPSPIMCEPGRMFQAQGSGLAGMGEGVGARDPNADQRAAEAIYGETAGLYPAPNNPRSAAQLEGGRRAIGLISERNRRHWRVDASRSRNPIEAEAWRRAQSAARNRHRANIPPNARYFYIRNRHEERYAPLQRPEQLGRAKYWGTFGTDAPFRSVGGGDAGRSDNVVIDIYLEPDD